MDKTEITQDIIDLVVSRLQTIPGDAQLSIGGIGTGKFEASDLINEVKNKTDVGIKIIESQLFYLRSLQDLPLEDHA